MLNDPEVVNQPLREKLEAWRAMKQIDGITSSTENVHRAPPVGWCRSVPAVRRNNLILKSTESTKHKFSKKDQKENHSDSHNGSQLSHLGKVPKMKDKLRVPDAKENTNSEKDQEIERLINENKKLSADLKVVTAACNDAIQHGKIAMDEVAAMNFKNNVLEQQNLELDCKLSSQRMNINENASEKSRKHKQDLARLQEEKDQYEKRADELIQQMNEQMSQLQTVAMDRIAV